MNLIRGFLQHSLFKAETRKQNMKNERKELRNHMRYCYLLKNSLKNIRDLI